MSAAIRHGFRLRQGDLSMAATRTPIPHDDDQKRQARKKENNPFSEQEKHGEEAQRRNPSTGEEYQGTSSVQRRAPGVEDDNEQQ
jgi:hypothetical protein